MHGVLTNVQLIAARTPAAHTLAIWWERQLGRVHPVERDDSVLAGQLPELSAQVSLRVQRICATTQLERSAHNMPVVEVLHLKPWLIHVKLGLAQHDLTARERDLWNVISGRGRSTGRACRCYRDDHGKG